MNADTTWSILDSYFQDGRALVKHQLDSYNDFVFRKIDLIIDGFNPIDICHEYLPSHNCFKHVLTATVENPRLSKPVIHEKDGSTQTMLPRTARLRGLSYSTPLFVDLHIVCRSFDPDSRKYIQESKSICNVSLGRIPIMVRSRYCLLSDPAILAGQEKDECRNDLGGYFIINGNEKVLVSQDRIAENRAYVFVSNKVSAYSHTAEVRSMPEGRFGVPKTTSLKLSSRPTQFGRFIRASVHHVNVDVPLFVLFRALGIESDRDIVRLITGGDTKDPAASLIVRELIGSVDDGSHITCTRDALEYMSRFLNAHGHPRDAVASAATSAAAGANAHAIVLAHRVAVLRGVLAREFLPHVGPELRHKAHYLGYMAGKLIRCYLGLWPMDDRDSYANKRLDTPGVLLAGLFRQYYGKVVKDLRNALVKDINTGAWRASNRFISVIGKGNIYKLMKPTVIESGLKYGLSTGNWGMKSSRMRQGVAQVLNRMTHIATSSHLRRVNTPIEKTGKLVQPRKLHPTQWGIVCPAETPEGASIGLVKNLSLTVTVTFATSSEPVRRHILNTPEFFSPIASTLSPDKRATRVFVNGDLCATCTEPATTVERLRDLKRAGALSVHTSVVWDVFRNDIQMCTDGGRYVRPLLIMSEDGRTTRIEAAGPELLEKVRQGKVSWHDLVLGSGACSRSMIEYLDVDETNHMLIRMQQQEQGSAPSAHYTHAELTPEVMFGTVAGTIPFSDHNQAPRNTYQSAMGKQAIGLYATSFRQRYDTMAHVLNYPQLPLVSTRLAKVVGVDAAPCGINTIVAIATYTGFNQEDSVIFNKSAVDRGLMVSTYYKTFREQNSKNHSTGEEEYFCKPPAETTANVIRPYNYSKLNEDGFVDADTYVEAGDVIIGKCMPQKQGSHLQSRDTSIVLRTNERGYVDRNCFGNKEVINVNGDGYSFCKVRLRNQRVPTVGDKFSCYTADHDVLTERGWMRIVDLVKMHEIEPTRVATLVRRGAAWSMEYQVPVAVQRYDVDVTDGMCWINSPDVDLFVTSSHRLLRVSESGFHIVTAAELIQNYSGASFLLGVDAFVGSGAVSVSGDESQDWWAPDSGVWALDSYRALEVLRCLTRGESVVSVASEEEAGALQRLALHAGSRTHARIATDRNSKKIRVYITWGGREPGTGTANIDVLEHTGVLHRFKEAVYCCTVPGELGMIYVRRNGKSVWCGNSRHGQKGTMGMQFSQEDMPFTSSGIVPDVIINPHAIPSRMTIGQLMECVLGKVCCTVGKRGDGSPFNGISVEDIAERLENCGMHRYGDEILYNGRTGEQMPVAIFVGPTYYQRLKHMVEDKIHSRAHNGPVVLLTRQPAEGRARDGGLRLGEMEIECNWAHGMMHFLKERILECSDNYRMFVCATCGMFATAANPEAKVRLCKLCQNTTSFFEVRMPYACKLLVQEVETMGIGAKFICS